MEKSIKTIVVILIVAGIGFFAYTRFKGWHEEKVEVAIEQERDDWKKKTTEMEDTIKSQQEDLEIQKEAIVPKEKIVQAFGEDVRTVGVEPEENDCEEISKPVLAFFEYLDNKEYILSHGLKTGTYDVFIQSMNILSENLPMVTDETKDLLSLMHNVAHFYRVLGKKRVNIAREIINNETELMESMMATLYTWSLSKERCPEQIKDSPSLEVLYEYAGFFLNTLAGRSYLLRRDSKVRILTGYYSVLVLDAANKKKMNINGIDIKPHIVASYNNIVNQSNLIHRNQYLLTLENLKIKYEN